MFKRYMLIWQYSHGSLQASNGSHVGWISDGCAESSYVWNFVKGIVGENRRVSRTRSIDTSGTIAQLLAHEAADVGYMFHSLVGSLESYVAFPQHSLADSSHSRTSFCATSSLTGKAVSHGADSHGIDCDGGTAVRITRLQ